MRSQCPGPPGHRLTGPPSVLRPVLNASTWKAKLPRARTLIQNVAMFPYAMYNREVARRYGRSARDGRTPAYPEVAQ